MQAVFEMTPDEKLAEWKRQLQRLGINPKQAAARLKVNSQTAYNWNCGASAVPERRLKQLAAMREQQTVNNAIRDWRRS